MASELKKKAFWRAVIAEFLAMILFVFISIGAALGMKFPIEDKTNQTASSRSQDIVKVSLAFGISIATMAQSVGHISGAHLNPAVTLGCLLSCQISILKAVMYIIAQCMGAVVATAILSGITSNAEDNSLGLNSVSWFVCNSIGADLLTPLYKGNDTSQGNLHHIFMNMVILHLQEITNHMQGFQGLRASSLEKCNCACIPVLGEMSPIGNKIQSGQ